MDGEPSDNFFKNLFTTAPISDNEPGIKEISMPSYATGIVGNSLNDLKNGKFLVDSFTYTPFVDYANSSDSSEIGIYAD